MQEDYRVQEKMRKLMTKQLSPFDLLPHTDLREKFIDLVLNGEPTNIDHETSALFQDLRRTLTEKKVEDVRVVVFGGGSGLSNVIGGDSRRKGWQQTPFFGLKEIFPRSRSIVCITDDGGSTGELLKDLPLIAIGDIRHVLLSSIQLAILQKRYSISVTEATEVAATLGTLFNYRYVKPPTDRMQALEDSRANLDKLPFPLQENINAILEHLFTDSRLASARKRGHCLGNLFVIAAVFREIDSSLSLSRLETDSNIVNSALFKGLSFLTEILGAEKRAVLPCTSTPAQLRFLYSNGVQITGEGKSGTAMRGFPVERVFVDFAGPVHVYPEILTDIKNADILLMAPGSLYSSIIPIFHVPGLAQTVRENTHALKLLISNLWVQAGETDRIIEEPERKFHVSDMLRAYERNIPGGTKGLFNEVLCLSLKDVPASILQQYEIEGKVPIYLDRNVVCDQGFIPIECGIYSKAALAERGVIQHDPEILAQAIKTIFVGSVCYSGITHDKREVFQEKDVKTPEPKRRRVLIPSVKFKKIQQRLDEITIEFQSNGASALDHENIRSAIGEIIWKHQDIPLSHLEYFTSIKCIPKSHWRRNQRWDNVFSFFDPEDSSIKIRQDQFDDLRRLEPAFLIALGESLLGNYAARKEMKTIQVDDIPLGKVYHLFLLSEEKRICFFKPKELKEYLILSKMFPVEKEPLHYTRLINGDEGFTPPGLLMGLIYAWYLENRLASHIEYKMSLMQIKQTDLIPEQLKMLKRRERVTSFFREVVFCL